MIGLRKVKTYEETWTWSKKRRSGFSIEMSNCRGKRTPPRKRSQRINPPYKRRIERRGKTGREGKSIKTLFWNVAGMAIILGR